MTVVYGAALAMVSVAGLLTVARLVRGPAALDRIIALDVLVTLVVAGTAVGLAWQQETSPMPVLIVLALLAFVGSVAAAHLIEKRQGMR